jgi:hypothetical protein
MVCESCESRPVTHQIRKDSQRFANPQSRANARDSQHSQHSHGGESETHSQARLEAVRARLAAWGWPEPEAERVAQRIAQRDALDDRKTCAECSRYRHSLRRCADHRRAGLASAEVGRELAALNQRCPAFAEADTPGGVKKS